MNAASQLRFEQYSNAGDVAVIAICIIISILLLTSYVSRTRSLRIYLVMIAVLVLAAGINIAYHALLEKSADISSGLIYFCRLLYHIFLFDAFFLFCLYATQVSRMEHRDARRIAIMSTLLFAVIIAAIAPIIIAFPFFQDKMEKGVIQGGVKG